MIETNDQTVVNFKTQKAVRDKASKAFSKVGLDMSSALNLFLYNVTLKKSLYLNMVTENGYTVAEEMEMIESLHDTSTHKTFKNTKEMFAELEK